MRILRVYNDVVSDIKLLANFFESGRLNFDNCIAVRPQLLEILWRIDSLLFDQFCASLRELGSLIVREYSLVAQYDVHDSEEVFLAQLLLNDSELAIVVLAEQDRDLVLRPVRDPVQLRFCAFSLLDEVRILELVVLLLLFTSLLSGIDG